MKTAQHHWSLYSGAIELTYGVLTLLGLLGLLAIPAPVWAQDSAQPADPPKETPAAPKLDRVTTTDGASINATVKSVTAKEVVVTSTDLGDLKVATPKIAKFWLGEPREFYLKTGKMEPEQKLILTANEAGKLEQRPADKADAQPTPVDLGKIFTLQNSPAVPEKWTLNAGSYLALTRGNVKNVSWGLFGQVTRETFWDFAQIRYEFGYTETSVSGVNLVTNRAHNAHALYRYFFSDMWGAFIKDTFTANLFAGIRFRNVIDLGGSFTAYRESHGHLTFDLSVNYTVEKLVGALSTDYAGGKAALDFKHVIESITFLLAADITINFRVTDAWLGHVRFEAKNDFGGGLAMSIVIEDFYNNRPATGFLANDFRITATVGIEFSPS